MIPLNRLNLLYGTSTNPIDIEIVSDEQFAKVRKVYRQLRDKLENSNEARIEAFLSGTGFIFRELYSLPLEIEFNQQRVFIAKNDNVAKKHNYKSGDGFNVIRHKFESNTNKHGNNNRSGLDGRRGDGFIWNVEWKLGSSCN